MRALNALPPEWRIQIAQARSAMKSGTAPAPTDDNGNSTDPADWQASILGVLTEFGKVAADNLKRDEVRQQEQALANPPFNWKPWAIGGGVILAVIALLKALKVF